MKYVSRVVKNSISEVKRKNQNELILEEFLLSIRQFSKLWWSRSCFSNYPKLESSTNFVKPNMNLYV